MQMYKCFMMSAFVRVVLKVLLHANNIEILTYFLLLL